MQKQAKWVVKEPNKPGRVEEVVFDCKNEDEWASQALKLCQKLVGGYVEQVPLGPGVFILCNEEAGLRPDKFKHNCGYLGTLIFVGEEEGEEGDMFWSSLKEDEIAKVLNWCDRHEGKTYQPSRPQIITGVDILAHLKARNASLVAEWESL